MPTTMSRPRRTADLPAELAEVLLYVHDHELTHGNPPTRAAADVRGYGVAVAQLVARGYLHHPRLGLSRLTLTPAGRQLAEELS